VKIPGIQGLFWRKIIYISQLLAGVFGQLVGVVLDLVPEKQKHRGENG
jgi:hypothetical protein